MIRSHAQTSVRWQVHDARRICKDDKGAWLGPEQALGVPRMSSRMMLRLLLPGMGLAVRHFSGHSDGTNALPRQLYVRWFRRNWVLSSGFLVLVVALIGFSYFLISLRQIGNLPPMVVNAEQPVTVVTDGDPLEVYRFGVVPQFDSRQLTSVWLPLLKQVEIRAGCRLEYKGTKDIPTFEMGFEEGDFDFAYMNPYHSSVAWDKQKYTPLIRDHSRQLYGIIVVRKDSEIENVEDLNGETLAFPAPNALGASLLMRAELRNEHQLDFTPLYAETHDSVYLSVISGKCVAGCGVMSTFNQQEDRVKDQLRVIYTTRKLAPHPVVSHPRVPAEVVARVQRAFYEVSQAPCWEHLLANVPMNTPGPATRKDYEELEQLGLEEFYVRPR